MNKLSLSVDPTRPQQPRPMSPALTDSRLVFSFAAFVAFAFSYIAFFFDWTAFVQPSHVSPAASTAIATLGHPLTTPSGQSFIQKATPEIKTGLKTVLPYLTKLLPERLGESVGER